MRYLVMECHLSYAVVLTEDGRFLRVANQHYTVGQTVWDVMEMQASPAVSKGRRKAKWIYPLAALAACFILAIAAVFQIDQRTYASVYLTINPEVRIDVNRKNLVVGLTGINPEGEGLIAGYSYRHQPLEAVMDDLVDRAIEMEYLHEGGRISLVLDAESDEWAIQQSDALTDQLRSHLEDKISVTIEVTNSNTQSNQIIIPVDPPQSSYGDDDYGDDIQPSPTPQPTAVSDSGYGDDDDGQTDYGLQADSGYGSSPYASQAPGGSGYGNSGWGDSDSDADSDSGYGGQSGYGGSDDDGSDDDSSDYDD